MENEAIANKNATPPSHRTSVSSPPGYQKRRCILIIQGRSKQKVKRQIRWKWPVISSRLFGSDPSPEELRTKSRKRKTEMDADEERKGGSWQF